MRVLAHAILVQLLLLLAHMAMLVHCMEQDYRLWSTIDAYRYPNAMKSAVKTSVRVVGVWSPASDSGVDIAARTIAV